MYSIQKFAEESDDSLDMEKHGAGVVNNGHIPEEFKCPICFEIPQAEIYQCHSGHTICSSCYMQGNMRKCPQCRIPFLVEGKSLIRNRALETLLDSMIVPCPYTNNGCLETISRKNLKIHTINCMHNGRCLQLCKLLGYKCDFRTNAMNSKSAVDHFRRHHNAPLVQDNRSIITIDIENFVRSTRMMIMMDGVWTPVIIHPSNDDGDYLMILILLNTRDRTVSWMGLKLDHDDVAHNNEAYDIEFRIENQAEEVPPLKIKIPPVPVLKSAEMIRNPVIRTPIDVLEDFYVDKKNEMLKVTVSVHKSPKNKNYGIVKLAPVKICEITARNQFEIKFWEDIKAALPQMVKPKIAETMGWVRGSLGMKK